MLNLPYRPRTACSYHSVFQEHVWCNAVTLFASFINCEILYADPNP
jgi:hypothetical protein